MAFRLRAGGRNEETFLSCTETGGWERSLGHIPKLPLGHLGQSVEQEGWAEVTSGEPQHSWRYCQGWVGGE